MKKAVGLITAVIMGTALAGAVWADTFTVSATVPLASSVTILPSRVVSATGVATAVTGTALSMNPLTFNATNGIWLPDHYFRVDFATVGGAGSTNVQVSYTEGANPNSATTTHGLGWKTTATFVRINGTTETGIALTGGAKKMLKDMSTALGGAAVQITPTLLSGGALRIYLGIVSKDPAATFPDPAASEPFTNGDRPGTYDGTLTITATPA